MLNFNGTTDLIDCGSAASIDNIFSAGGTAMAWFKAESLGGGGWGRVFDKATTGISSTGGWRIYVDNITVASSLAFTRGYTTTNGGWRSPANSLILNDWMHIAVTYTDGVANDPIIYINGVSVVVTEITTPAGSAESDAANTLFIGNAVSVARGFDGPIGDARCYTRVLSAAEIRTIYSCRGKDGVVDGLVARWVMSEKHPGASPDIGAVRVDSWTGETQYETNGFTYSPAAGSNRAAIVFVTTESDTSPAASVSNVVLGTQTLTSVNTTTGIVVGTAPATHNLVWMGYLNETQIGNMSGNTLSVSWANPPSLPFGDSMVQACTYENINQSNPISDNSFNTDSSGTSIAPGTLTVAYGGKVVYGSLCGNLANQTSPAGYTEQLEQDGDTTTAFSNASVERDNNYSGFENPTSSWSINQRLAIIGFVLNGSGENIIDYSNNKNNGEPTSSIVYSADRISTRKVA